MPGYLYFALKCMQNKTPKKKKKKKKKKLLLDVILFHTYMRNFDLDLLALLFYYFGISHWFY